MMDMGSERLGLWCVEGARVGLVLWVVSPDCLVLASLRVMLSGLRPGRARRSISFVVIVLVLLYHSCDEYLSPKPLRGFPT